MRDVAIRAVREGGAVLLANLERPKTVEFKSAGKDPQITSNVDREAEEKIVEIIRAAYPGHCLLTEESGLLGSAAEYTWIVDALDGTTQYVRRLPYFAVSVALRYRDEVVLSAVYSPHLDELFTAEKGQGAFLNDRRLRVSDVGDLSSALIVSSVLRSYIGVGRQDVFYDVLGAVSSLRIYGSPAIDLCYIADGRLDARVTANTEPWDHSAACLIVEEAGGRVTDWNGRQWSPDSKNLLTTNGPLHELLFPLLRGGPRA